MFEVGRGCLVMVDAGDDDDTAVEVVLVEIPKLVELLCDRVVDEVDEEVSESVEVVLVLPVERTVEDAEDVDFATDVFAFVAVPGTTVAGAVENVLRAHNQSARSPLNACAMTVSGFTP